MAPLVAGCLRSRWVSLLCLAAVALAAVLPPSGPALPLCSFKEVTGLPCFTCGLTRSVIGLGHLDPARAGLYHPGGILVFAGLLALAALLAVPAAGRERVARWAEENPRLLNYLAAALLALFVLYGSGRLAYCWWLLGRGRSFVW